MKPPSIPLTEDTPCRNEDVSGQPGKDLWFGEGWGGGNVSQALDHAATLCDSVCKAQFPEAYAACREYALEVRPNYGVYGGIKPRSTK